MKSMPRPPGPRDPFFGIRILRAMERDFLGFWRSLHQRYGDATHMRVFGYDYYSFVHPEQIRQVLVEKADSFIRFERHMEVLSQLHGQSLLTTEGEVWKKQRRTLMPGFSPKRFPHYARQMTDAVSERLATLPADGSTPVDVEHAMNMLAADVVLRTMFSSRVAEDTTEIEQAVRSLSQIGYEEMFLPFAVPDWLPLRRKVEKQKARKLLDDLIWSHIHVRRAQPEPGEDLLGMLLSAADKEGDGSGLTDREVRDQLMTIFLAGHETTAAGLAWAGWELATQPGLAARAAAEVDQVLGGRVPGFADVAQLPFLNAFIKENLRLNSPAPGVFLRRATRDVQVGQWTVPKGSLVSIVSFITHRDPRWFADPDKFDPSRFEGEMARTIERGAYFPFGAGPRVCIGNSFAAMEMALILAMLLQRFVLRPAPGYPAPGFRMQVTLRAANGVHLVLEERKGATAQGAPRLADAATASACPFHRQESPVVGMSPEPERTYR